MFRRLLVCSLLIGGCSESRSLLVEGTPAPPDGSCTFSTDGDLALNPLVIDVGESLSFRVPLVISNESSRGVTADRLDFRWECNEIGFQVGAAPLYVPALSPSTPFCLSTQAAEGAPFVGFGLVGANSPRIGPNEVGLAVVDLVPPTLGNAFDQTFSLARLADACVRSNPVADPSTPECQAFVDEFGPGATPDDVFRLAPFASYDGRYVDEVIVMREGSTPPLLGPAYPLSIHAILFGLDDNGNEVRSNEFELAFDLCRNCGPRQADVRQPRAGFECYH